MAVHPTTGDLYYSDARCGRVRRVHGRDRHLRDNGRPASSRSARVTPRRHAVRPTRRRGRCARWCRRRNVPVVAGGTNAASAATAARPLGAGQVDLGPGHRRLRQRLHRDEDNRRVRRVTPGGPIRTVLGTGSSDEGPDGRPPPDRAGQRGARERGPALPGGGHLGPGGRPRRESPHLGRRRRRLRATRATGDPRRWPGSSGRVDRGRGGTAGRGGQPRAKIRGRGAARRPAARPGARTGFRAAAAAQGPS